MSLQKPLAASAGVIAAIAAMAPAASASAATTAPAARTAQIAGVGFAPGLLPCQILASQIQLALQFGNTPGATVLSNIFVDSGCGGAAI